MKTVLKETRERMQKSLESFEKSIAVIRTGRANPAMLSRVMVNYYVASTPLNQLAAVSSPVYAGKWYSSRMVSTYGRSATSMR